MNERVYVGTFVFVRGNRGGGEGGILLEEVEGRRKKARFTVHGVFTDIAFRDD